MAAMARLIFSVLVIVSPLLTLTVGRRYGQQAKTLHLAKEIAQDLYEKGFHYITVPKDEISDGLGKIFSRHKRSITNTSVTAPKITSVNELHDNHYQMIIHWAGENSDVIVALTRDLEPTTLKSTSVTYLSYDYGRTFSVIRMPLNSTHNATIDKFYNSPVYNSHYVFADVINKVLFTTTNYGRNFNKVTLDFRPKEISMHSKDEQLILSYDKDDPLKRLHISRNFGITWETLEQNVKSYFWGVEPYDYSTDLFIERTVFTIVGYGVSSIFKINSATYNNNENYYKDYADDYYDSDNGGFGYRTTIISGVEDFEVKDDYMFASRRVSHSTGNSTLEFWVSHRRAPFQRAEFPSSLVHNDYYVADASEEQVFLCVSHEGAKTNLYISEMHGTSFTLSLEDVVYYNPEGPVQDTWLEYYAKESFADIHKVNGLKGIYIASVLQNNTQLNVSKQDTMITFDKGGFWTPVLAPSTDSEGKRTNCSSAFDWSWRFFTGATCTLHLTQKFQQLYPQYHTVPILSKESAVGLIFASGNMNKTVTKDVNIFRSSDAGRNWHEVLKGAHFYAFGDHGGIVIAVKQKEETDEILYSTDEGTQWTTYRFAERKMRVYGVLTEPGEKTMVFSLFGSHLAGGHSWVIIQVNLTSVFRGKNCTAEDYKNWSPSDNGYENCLLGQKFVYQRRRANSFCFNGREFDREVLVQNCSCNIMDYECDFGYQKRYSWSQTCDRVPNSGLDVHAVPNPCPLGTYYTKTKGYRRIEGDYCSGGDEYRFEPDRILCPSANMTDYVIYVHDGSLRTRSLASAGGGNHEELNIPISRFNTDAISAVTYDYGKNCVYWVDTTQNAIQRMCLNGRGALYVNDTVVEERTVGNNIIKDISFDFMSNTIYWTTTTPEIHIAKIDSFGPLGYPHRKRLLYAGRNGFPSGSTQNKGLKIEVFPQHGYMFWTDPRDNSVYRGNLDGYNVTKILPASAFDDGFEPGYIAVDGHELKIYVSDVHNNVVWSANFNGGDRVKIILGQNMGSAFIGGLAIYKDNIYWLDSIMGGIYYKNKYDTQSRNRQTLLDASNGNRVGARDICIVDQASHQVQVSNNPCGTHNGQCVSICVERPGSAASPMPLNRTCLCADTFASISMSSQGTHDEHCQCGANEKVQNGTCVPTNGTCADHEFSCWNGRCIQLTWKCDRDNDCGDYSDEMDCPYHTCTPEQFTCKGRGNCIPKRWVCDHDNDCEDKSDEPGDCTFPTCNSDQYACNNGRCVPTRWRCDGDDDCSDGSDEIGCTYPMMTTVATPRANCSSAEFTCIRTQKCIPLNYTCDGEYDCYDESYGIFDLSDEFNCSQHNCASDEFHCSESDQCIPLGWHCDLEEDCREGDDEKNCSSVAWTTTAPVTRPSGNCNGWYSFSCANGNCVTPLEVCDGINDCADNSDEQNCHMSTLPPRTCPPDSIPCDYNKCVSLPSFCNGVADCYDGTDEPPGCHQRTTQAPTCSWMQYACAGGGYPSCIYSRWVCDGEADCMQGDDEQNCNNTVTCGAGFLPCPRSTGCFAPHWVCDGDSDCIDGSDEENCYTSEVTTEVPRPCAHYEWTCPGQRCIDMIKRCNRVLDCPDGSDEAGCDYGRLNITMSQDCNSTEVFISFSGTVADPSKTKIKAMLLTEPKARNKTIAYSTDSKEMQVKFGNLKPYTYYRFMAVILVDDKEVARLEPQHFTTKMGIPSAPHNLQVTANNKGNNVTVKFYTPAHPNGELQKFIVYYEALKGDSQKVFTKIITVHRSNCRRNQANSVECQVYGAMLTNLEPGTRYNVWVTAVNRLGYESEKSETKAFTYMYKALEQCIGGNNWTVNSDNEGEIVVRWTPIYDSTHLSYYGITFESSETGDIITRMIPLDSKTESKHEQLGYSYAEKHLPLGEQLLVTITVYDEQGTSSDCVESRIIIVSGAKLPKPLHITTVQVDNATSFQVNWTVNLPPDGTGETYQYAVYWSQREVDLEHYDIHLRANNKTNVQSGVKISGLETCEEIFVKVQIIVPAEGPLSEKAQQRTGSDLNAAPKNLNITTEKIDSKYGTVKVKWDASCEYLPFNLSYIVRVKEVKNGQYTDMDGASAVPATSTKRGISSEMRKLLRGATYNISVSRNSLNAISSKEKQITIEPYPGPIECHVTGQKSFYITWKPAPEVPANMTAGYEIYHSEMPNTNGKYVGTFQPLVNVSKDEFSYTVKNPKKNFDHTYKIRIADALGYPGKFSDCGPVYAPSPEKYANLDNSSNKKDPVSSGFPTIIVIVVACAIVVIICVVVLSVYIVRHRRLQRSFLSFANSHYDTRTGSTTFSASDDLAEEEEPMIRGFSDDEPLVVA